ncbi:glycosyltransferase family 2 protein [Luteimonas sp. MC1572]|uniref:glycosyltransferase family 2 protein n=1 Tax=Luteimonas sp. MC1572 TaxID=2799325 RepID=UPI0018F0E140|nr:glycosyltransferase family 2 protein [Luteimonas sp. MC1572]MBJ6982588.1 glycosyltransferase [Luteimonas sp. MC1572]QQO03836.1 glycosyltransferase [Luteimonas sp. MC1572]
MNHGPLPDVDGSSAAAASLELTILMPCLDEAETLAACIRMARAYLSGSGVRGEVLVADNGSTDGSQRIAEREGARVVDVAQRGYGAALAAGIGAARGRYVVMGDADASYDFSRLDAFLDALRAGSDLVIGNRFRGGIAPGAMPFLHRYLGNPVLSFLGRLFYGVQVRDFHCGLRGFNRDRIAALGLVAPGMEFASEMVVKASLAGCRISEVPTTLRPDGRSRPPHLRTWRDGWRHLRFLLVHSPRWLFLLPGSVLVAVGGAAMAVIGVRSVSIGALNLDVHTLSYAGAAIVLGVQMLLFAVLTTSMGIRHGWLPADGRGRGLLSAFTLERCLVAAALMFLAGIAMSLHAVYLWAARDFGVLDPSATMRWVIPSVTLMGVGGQVGLAAFFLEALRLPDAPR